MARKTADLPDAPCHSAVPDCRRPRYYYSRRPSSALSQADLTSAWKPHRTAGVRASSSMSVDHVPWSSEMPSRRGWKPGSRRGQPRCPRRPSAGPASLRWDMNYPPTN